MSLTHHQQTLLNGWEEVYKKGQLTLWVMLALRDGPKHMSEIKDFIEKTTNGTLTADDHSLYRSLRRYYDVDMINYSSEPGEGGPERKVYKLTDTGQLVMQSFVKRNILDIFYKPKVKELLR